MAVRQPQDGRYVSAFPLFDEDDEDHLATVIMADRATEPDRTDPGPMTRMQRPDTPSPRSYRPTSPALEAEGVLIEEDTPETEQRYWPAARLTATSEWEVTEQMPMPSETPPDLRRAVSPAPLLETPRFFDITEEVPRRREHHPAEWSEVSDTPPTLSNQPTFYEDTNSFVPLVATIAIPAIVSFALALWWVG